MIEAVAERFEGAPRQIADMIEIKENLMTEIADWIGASHLTQAEVAEKLHVARPRCFRRGHTADTLIEMVQRIARELLCLRLGTRGNEGSLETRKEPFRTPSLIRSLFGRAEGSFAIPYSVILI